MACSLRAWGILTHASYARGFTAFEPSPFSSIHYAMLSGLRSGYSL